MKKLILLLLVLSLAVSSAITLAACDMSEDTPADKPSADVPQDKDYVYDGNGVIRPPKREYLHSLASIGEIEYARPEVERHTEVLSKISKKIEEEDDYDIALSYVIASEPAFIEIRTMYTIAELESMKDSSSTYWKEEYEYLSTSTAAYNKALEDMFVACAKSPFKERFEEEYFKMSLDEYADGGKYTDELVRLEELEGGLIAEYTSLSPDNFARAEEIYVELIKIRRQIADELGLDSYTEYAYDGFGRDYMADEMQFLLNELGDFVMPIYYDLYYNLFIGTFNTHTPSEVDKIKLLNDLYRVYEDVDENIFEAYSYLIECDLYDMKPYSDTRYEGAFTTYVSGIDAPYIFMTAYGDVSDYSTLSHEFGHFFDAYANFTLGQSLDLAEISSQALELMTSLWLGGILSEDDIKYVSYYQIFSALDSVIYQSFISLFEHKVYSLPEEEITLENLKALAKSTETELLGGDFGLGQLENLIMQHTVAYPHYVESYCTSLLVSLDIFLMECEEKDAGINLYVELVMGGDPIDKNFQSELERVGLDSPFEEGYVISILDDLYYYLSGKHYIAE